MSHGPALHAPLIEARDLTKRFDEFVAVDGIDVEVRPGESFGFLGPNGAGKSSTMRMIGCVSPVTEGELRIFGLDPAGRAGAAPERNALPLAGREQRCGYLGNDAGRPDHL